MNETFIRLIAALAFCDTNEPGNDDHKRWAEILRAIWKQQSPLGLAFLASINRNGLPNESPAELLLRAHQTAKALLPDLAVKHQTERREAAAETNHEKLLREAIEDCRQWAEQGFPGATPEDLVRILCNEKPEKQVVAIRLRAEREFRKMVGLPRRYDRREPSANAIIAKFECSQQDRW